MNEFSSFYETASNDKDFEEEIYGINEEPLFPEQISISNSIQQVIENKNRTSTQTISSKKRIAPKFICQNFGVKKRKGRIRKIIKKKGFTTHTKKIHSACDFDNNLRKIQNHFLNFVIFTLNKVVYTFLNNKKYYFIKFKYSEKRNVNYDFVEKLKKYNIKELIKNIDVSPKYKRMNKKFDKSKKDEEDNINKNNLNYLSQYFWFNEFINKNYLELFRIYYNNEPIIVNGIEIILADNTNNFKDLLKNNELYKNKLIETAEVVFLNNN